jgi:hypothetical protein
MKQILTTGFLVLSILSYGQKPVSKTYKPITAKYGGNYSFGTDIEKGRIGNIIVYPETDSTILFYVDVNRGAPSYNMGALYGRAKITGGRGTFYINLDSSDKGCKWEFKFSKGMVSLKTIDSYYDCGFGNAVYVDGDFKQSSSSIPVNFEDLEGNSISFKTTTPEDYNKNH